MFCPDSPASQSSAEPYRLIAGRFRGRPSNKAVRSSDSVGVAKPNHTVPTGLAALPPPGPGDAGHAQGIIGSGNGFGAACHFRRPFPD